MNVFCYFNKEDLGKLLQELTSLEKCQVDAIGESEKRSKSDVLLVEAMQTQQFINSHEEGFFLHSDKGLFGVSIHKNSFSSVCFYPSVKLDDQEIIEVLKAYAVANAEFGYAADEDEFEHRNRIKVKFSGSEAESWVGRNLTRYLPGLYCFTLVSKKQLIEKSINLEMLKANSISHVNLTDNAVLFRFFDDSNSWEREKEKLDQLCRSSDKIFCKDEAYIEAKNSENVMDFIMKVREWN